MPEIQLSDKDYTLTDGKAWFSVGAYSIRINTTNSGSVTVKAWLIGEEDGDPLAEMEIA